MMTQRDRLEKIGGWQMWRVGLAEKTSQAELDTSGGSGKYGGNIYST